jgi:hypothetical protein
VRQEFLLDDCPLAELWENPAPFRENPSPAPKPPAASKPLVNCLNCGKPTDGALVCNAACRVKFQARMNRFHSSLKPCPASAYAGGLFEE